MSFFTLKFPIWIYFTVTLTIYFLDNFISNIKHKKWWNQNAVPIIESAERTIEKSTSLLKAIRNYPQIFISNNSPENSYLTYGQKRYDTSSQQLAGIAGTGSFHLKDNILTVERTNIDGRFIIRICKNYYGNSMMDHVSKNLYGRNPRCIKFQSFMRCSGGNHKVFYIIKKYETDEWINNIPIEISSVEWKQQNGSFNVPINEDFQIQIETFITSTKPEVIQIKDLLFEEV